MKKLRDLVVDETFETFVLLKTADVRVARNGKKFIAFTFQDNSGTIDGKYWGASDEDIATFTTGNVVLLNGKRELYQNMPQVKIMHLRLAKEGEPRDPSLYMEKAPIDIDEMKQEFNDYLLDITQAKWHRIVRHIFSKYQKEFFEYPAAKRNHHAFAGGLAFHTLTMLRLAKSVANEYSELNPSLLYAGVMLHDLGKVHELSGPVATEYTLAGNLLGHIVMIDEEITTACIELNIPELDEEVLVLKHVVLAHHGLLEYGSPVRPKIMEAEVLHHLDNLDASIQMMLGSLKQINPGEYTERIFGLDNRNFYLPNI